MGVEGHVLGGLDGGALDDGALEGVPSINAAERREMADDAARAGGLADDGDGVGVAAKALDVETHPVHGQALVVEPGVGVDVELEW